MGTHWRSQRGQRKSQRSILITELDMMESETWPATPSLHHHYTVTYCHILSHTVTISRNDSWTSPCLRLELDVGRQVWRSSFGLKLQSCRTNQNMKATKATCDSCWLKWWLGHSTELREGGRTSGRLTCPTPAWTRESLTCRPMGNRENIPFSSIFHPCFIHFLIFKPESDLNHETKTNVGHGWSWHFDAFRWNSWRSGDYYTDVPSFCSFREWTCLCLFVLVCICVYMGFLSLQTYSWVLQSTCSTTVLTANQMQHDATSFSRGKAMLECSCSSCFWQQAWGLGVR